MDYPATLAVRTPPRLANWRPLVQWILAIPHLIIAGALSYASGAVAVITEPPPQEASTQDRFETRSAPAQNQ